MWFNNFFFHKKLLRLNIARSILAQNDINIRQSIGEAVPTEIFRQIAENIKKAEDQ